MTLAIHDQGGLTEAEIKLAIEESAERREAVMDTKLAAHRAEIKAELDKTVALVNVNNDRLIDMQGQISGLAAETRTQTELLEDVARKGDEWHAADLVFRADVLQRVGKIETDQADLTEAVSRLRWIGLCSHWLGIIARFTLCKLKEADLWKILAAVMLLWVLHLIAPDAATWIGKVLAK